ncbi:MAG TPA: DUF5063 domain-containing protein [Sedimenticola sp.]|nr:DUF5063 domain-containing protein [Sedimenticola sp.]
MNPHIEKMAEVARAYCSLIEKVEVADSRWLREMSMLLPRLHACVEALGTGDGEEAPTLAPDLDARFELFVLLRDLLGNRDGYWMEFDTARDNQGMSGSLADDLTDIYCELKHGLRLLDEEPGRAADDWRSGYHMHWGRHLVDAERHLYELRSQNRLRSE